MVSTVGRRPELMLRRADPGPMCRRVGHHWLAFVLIVAGVLLSGGCSGESLSEELVEAQQRLRTVASGSAAGQELGVIDDAVDPRELSHFELLNGRNTLRLGGSRLARAVGVLEFLENYIINVPPTAEFISLHEVGTSRVATNFLYADSGTEGDQRRAFERRVLGDAGGALLNGLPASSDPQLLHDAFFEAFEECGQQSPWPGAQLFETTYGRTHDYWPDHVERDFGLSYWEYKELIHECARYAANYPTLDAAVRDELLAPQRAHFAQEVLDGIDNGLPTVEVPPEYQDEVDDLRANGW